VGIFLRVMAVVLVVAVAAGIGAGVYNAGVTAGLAEAAQSAVGSGEPVLVPYGYGYGPYWHGPGFFGIFFWILGFFLVFALLRAAFGWGRGSGPRGRGGWGGRREMFEEMHRDLHRRDGPDGERAASPS